MAALWIPGMAEALRLLDPGGARIAVQDAESPGVSLRLCCSWNPTPDFAWQVPYH